MKSSDYLQADLVALAVILSGLLLYGVWIVAYTLLGG